jgi:hypothetical protein
MGQTESTQNQPTPAADTDTTDHVNNDSDTESSTISDQPRAPEGTPVDSPTDTPANTPVNTLKTNKNPVIRNVHPDEALYMFDLHTRSEANAMSEISRSLGELGQMCESLNRKLQPMKLSNQSEPDKKSEHCKGIKSSRKLLTCAVITAQKNNIEDLVQENKMLLESLEQYKKLYHDLVAENKVLSESLEKHKMTQNKDTLRGWGQ